MPCEVLHQQCRQWLWFPNTEDRSGLNFTGGDRLVLLVGGLEEEAREARASSTVWAEVRASRPPAMRIGLAVMRLSIERTSWALYLNQYNRIDYSCVAGGLIDLES